MGTSSCAGFGAPKRKPVLHLHYMLGLCTAFSNQEWTDDTVSKVQDRSAGRRELLPEVFRARGATEAARLVAAVRRLALRPAGPSKGAFQRFPTHRIR